MIFIGVDKKKDYILSFVYKISKDNSLDFCYHLTDETIGFRFYGEPEDFFYYLKQWQIDYESLRNKDKDKHYLIKKYETI